MVLDTESLKRLAQTLLELIEEFGKVSGYQPTHCLTQGVIANEVLLHLGLVPAVHRLQGTEQGPPARLDLGGAHFHQLTNGRDDLAEAKEAA